EAERLHARAVAALVDHRHVGAHVALERHQALGLELADRLAHRHHAHLQLGRDRAEHEPVAGRELLRRDALLDPPVGPLRLAERQPAVGLCHGGPRCCSKRARHCAFIGNSPSTGAPAATCSAIQASSSSCASAASATSSASDGGTTTTPSSSPTRMSPGCTVAPPQEIVTSVSHGTWRRPRTAGCRPAANTGRMPATASESRTPPSVTTPAAPRARARSARTSPSVPDPVSPRASMTITSPSPTASKQRFWAL